MSLPKKVFPEKTLAEFADDIEKNETRFIHALRNGSIQKQIQDDFGNRELADAVAQLAENRTIPDKTALFRLIYLLDPYRSYNFFKGYSVKNISQLSVLIEKSPNEAIRHIADEAISMWLSHTHQWHKELNEYEQKELIEQVKAIEEKYKLRSFETADHIILEMVYTLNPVKPYSFKDQQTAVTPVELALKIEQNPLLAQELFSGKIGIWLKCAGYSYILQEWEKAKAQYPDHREMLLEAFLQSCGLPPPKIKVTPTHLNVGTINYDGIARRVFVIEKEGRGYLYGKIFLKDEHHGLVLSCDTFNGKRTEVIVTYSPGDLKPRTFYRDTIYISAWHTTEKVESLFYLDCTYMDLSKTWLGKRYGDMFKFLEKSKKQNISNHLIQFFSYIIAGIGGAISFGYLFLLSKHFSHPASALVFLGFILITSLALLLSLTNVIVESTEDTSIFSIRHLFYLLYYASYYYILILSLRSFGLNTNIDILIISVITIPVIWLLRIFSPVSLWIPIIAVVLMGIGLIFYYNLLS